MIGFIASLLLSALSAVFIVIGLYLQATAIMVLNAVL
jgi:hypothetical protein